MLRRPVCNHHPSTRSPLGDLGHIAGGVCRVEIPGLVQHTLYNAELYSYKCRKIALETLHVGPDTASLTLGACDSCRRMKIRCLNKEDPPCQRCRSTGETCTFRQTTMPRPPDSE